MELQDVNGNPFLLYIFFNFQFVCFLFLLIKKNYLMMFIGKCFFGGNIIPIEISKKAEETWQWSNFNTGISTWNKEYLKNE